MPASGVRYLVFDVESAADGDLVSAINFPSEGLSATEAVALYRQQRLEKYDSDFIPYPFQVPVSIVVAKVDGDFRLLDIVALDEPEFRSHVMTEHFWRGWEMYGRPTFVSFNGRTFDMPLLELAAFRYGIPLASWMDLSKPSYQQPRNRYNVDAHLDLLDIVTNFGATRFNGGLNLAATLLGKPGKMEVKGDMVQDLYDEGQLAEINDYCRCDVLDTYFVLLRTAVVMGLLTLDREQQLVAESKQWLVERCDQNQAYRLYLDHWGDWPNPWQPDGEKPDESGSNQQESLD
jgi:predicted PolB exonuclease-like 3'-5' exonuclease